ncbi:YbjQ family protein [Paramicrobacterium chengjingii]|uniref:UPF0145 protein HCR76_17160 n=1 Tax=Paramicrobacterium chengjingii TaxID=2769067 RepID=A0ABX6YI54_9MICO|nr:YbjQ family protein [Microbacterium chengjingii]QPZ38482.1 YbjQ family protein [Microbacterium chengjingii]
MIIVTSNDIPGYRIEAVFGEVMGLTVRARDIGSQFTAGFRSLGGGELPEMTRMLYESRSEVMNRMVTEAQQRQANAIVAMRFDSSELGTTWTEVCAYGTAVYAVPLGPGEEGATPQSEWVVTNEKTTGGSPSHGERSPASPAQNPQQDHEQMPAPQQPHYPQS